MRVASLRAAGRGGAEAKATAPVVGAEEAEGSGLERGLAGSDREPARLGSEVEPLGDLGLRPLSKQLSGLCVDNRHRPRLSGGLGSVGCQTASE